MSVLIRAPLPPEISELVARRRSRGLDMFDEVWAGVLHMNPAPSGSHGVIVIAAAAALREPAARRGLTVTDQFNLGIEADFRVPDLGVHRQFTDQVGYPAAAIVVEVISPGDETWQKLDFYAAHSVEELVIVDPETCAVAWHELADGRYAPVTRSAVLDVAVAAVAAQIDWP